MLLARREIETRYGGTLLGAWWTLVTPLVYAGVLSAVFSNVRGFDVGGVPFVAYVLSGVVVLNYVTTVIMTVASSVTTNTVYLRRVFVPVGTFAASTALASLIMLTLTTVALMVVEVIAGQSLPWTIVLLPIAFVLLAIGVGGFGLFVGALASVFADAMEATRVLITVLGFATPIFYPVSIVPHRFRWAVEVNPIYHYVVLFRHLAYIGTLPHWPTLAVCVVSSAVALCVGGAAFSIVRRLLPTVL